MPLVLYSVLRVALLAVALAGLWAAGLRDWLLVAVAALVAAAASYVLLTRQRDAAALWIARRAEERRSAGVRVSPAIDEDAAHEDAAADHADQAGRTDRTDRTDQTDRTGQIARPRPSSTP